MKTWISCAALVLVSGAHLTLTAGQATGPAAYTTAQATHPAPFSASVQHGNFHGVQFHTEKSGTIGTLILANFLNL